MTDVCYTSTNFSEAGSIGMPSLFYRQDTEEKQLKIQKYHQTPFIKLLHAESHPLGCKNKNQKKNTEKQNKQQQQK